MKAKDRVDAKLDDALEMTFPASDAFTISFPTASDADRRSSDFDNKSAKRPSQALDSQT